MLKRTWLVAIGLLALGLALSACDAQSELAPELTPIPTLPPGQEPALVEALQPTPTAHEMNEVTTQGESSAELGEQLFAQTCAACHMDADTIGPGLPRIAKEAAATAAELGMSTEAYLHQSIVDPAAYVVEGFQPIMPNGYGDQYSEDELEALVAYIMAQGEGAMEAEEGAMDATNGTEDAASTEGAGDDAAAEGDAAADTGSAEDAAPAEGASDDAAAEGANMAAEPALVEQGELLFAQTCAACHMDVDAVGPSLPHIAASAPQIAAELGMSTEAYLHQSIVDPAAYVVEGFQPIMPNSYGDQYSEEELEALVAYIMAQGEGAMEAEEGAMDATNGTEDAAPAEGAGDDAAAEGDDAADTGSAEDAASAEGTGDDAAATEGETMAADPALVEQGELLFAQTCMACHMDVDTIGPSLPHIAASAPQIAAELGMSTEAYLRQSIVDPTAYVVEGFQPSMPAGYGERYTEEELQALIAYIMAQDEGAEHTAD